MAMTNSKKLVGMVSLGCDKNRVDAEKMLGALADAGFAITADANQADIIIVNTCAFIESAKKEAIESILDMAEVKKDGAKLIVTGCFSERYGQEVGAEFTEVDLFLPLGENVNIVSHVNALLDTPEQNAVWTGSRVLTTPYNYAYLKIADGCNNFCSFCAIPYIRGRYKSVDIDELVSEAKRLNFEESVSELVLVAQDTTRYGTDTKGPGLLTLLDKLTAIDGIQRVRVLYMYPELITNEIIDYFVQNPKVARYMDIPLQHADDAILKSMRRKNTALEAERLIDRIRTRDEDIAIRSSFIVGYPGETDEAFDKLYGFIDRYKLDYAGFFGYSPEEGTPAEKLRPRVKKSVVNQRLKAIRAKQAEVMQVRLSRLVGRTLSVVYEGIDYDKQAFFGRSEFQAPDVDPRVFFTSNEPLEFGKYYDVKITGLVGSDLKGETV